MNFIYETNKIYLRDDNGQTIAEVLFPADSDNTVNITHTFVNEALRGQNIAGQLMQAVAEQLRKDNKKARLTCSYAIQWFEKHPEYKDVIL